MINAGLLLVKGIFMPVVLLIFIAYSVHDDLLPSPIFSLFKGQNIHMQFVCLMWWRLHLWHHVKRFHFRILIWSFSHQGWGYAPSPPVPVCHREAPLPWSRCSRPALRWSTLTSRGRQSSTVTLKSLPGNDLGTGAFHIYKPIYNINNTQGVDRSNERVRGSNRAENCLLLRQ